MGTMNSGSIYENDVPSLSASLEAFDPERSMHSAYSGRSAMHSSARWSAQSAHEAEESEAESEGPWAPPAWQKSNNNWYRKSVLSESPMRSHPSRSPSYYFDRDVTPSRIPLPDSPLKQTPRTSPEPEVPPDNIASRMQSPSAEPQADAGAQQEDMALSQHEEEPSNLGGCTCSLSVVFDVQQSLT
jgi:hypothetical protein